jgi:hypothetical protein
MLSVLPAPGRGVSYSATSATWSFVAWASATAARRRDWRLWSTTRPYPSVQRRRLFPPMKGLVAPGLGASLIGPPRDWRRSDRPRRRTAPCDSQCSMSANANERRPAIHLHSRPPCDRGRGIHLLIAIAPLAGLSLGRLTPLSLPSTKSPWAGCCKNGYSPVMPMCCPEVA